MTLDEFMTQSGHYFYNGAWYPNGSTDGEGELQPWQAQQRFDNYLAQMSKAERFALSPTFENFMAKYDATPQYDYFGLPELAWNVPNNFEWAGRAPDGGWQDDGYGYQVIRDASARAIYAKVLDDITRPVFGSAGKIQVDYDAGIDTSSVLLPNGGNILFRRIGWDYDIETFNRSPYAKPFYNPQWGWLLRDDVAQYEIMKNIGPDGLLEVFAGNLPIFLMSFVAAPAISAAAGAVGASLVEAGIAVETAAIAETATEIALNLAKKEAMGGDISVSDLITNLPKAIGVIIGAPDFVPDFDFEGSIDLSPHELTQTIVSGDVADIAQDLTDYIPDALPDVTPDLTDYTSEITPDVAPEIAPDVAPDVAETMPDFSDVITSIDLQPEALPQAPTRFSFARNLLNFALSDYVPPIETVQEFTADSFSSGAMDTGAAFESGFTPEFDSAISETFTTIDIAPDVPDFNVPDVDSSVTEMFNAIDIAPVLPDEIAPEIINVPMQTGSDAFTYTDALGNEHTTTVSEYAAQVSEGGADGGYDSDSGGGDSFDVAPDNSVSEMFDAIDIAPTLPDVSAPEIINVPVQTPDDLITFQDATGQTRTMTVRDYAASVSEGGADSDGGYDNGGYGDSAGITPDITESATVPDAVIQDAATQTADDITDNFSNDALQSSIAETVQADVTDTASDADYTESLETNAQNLITELQDNAVNEFTSVSTDQADIDDFELQNAENIVNNLQNAPVITAPNLPPWMLGLGAALLKAALANLANTKAKIQARNAGTLTPTVKPVTPQNTNTSGSGIASKSASVLPYVLLAASLLLKG